jgi:hypothetical protein
LREKTVVNCVNAKVGGGGGGGGGDEEYATDADVDEMLDDVFGDN